MKLVLIYLALFTFNYLQCDNSMQFHSVNEEIITYKLEASEAYKIGEPIKIMFTFENKSDQILYLLKWYTPFEGFNGDLFRITLNGQVVRYEGRMVKRGEPDIDDYISIGPGKSVDTTVDLSMAYSLDKPGLYQVNFIRNISDLIFAEKDKNAKNLFPRTVEKHQPMEISGNSIILVIIE